MNPSFMSSLEACMQVFDSIRTLRDGKRYYTTRNTTWSENSSSGGSLANNSDEINERGGPNNRALAQEDVDVQIKRAEVALR